MIGKQSHQTKPQPSSERWNKIFVWFQRFSWRASPTPYKIQFLQEDSFTTRCITYPPTHRLWHAVTLPSYMHTYNIVQNFGNGYFRAKIYLYSFNIFFERTILWMKRNMNWYGDWLRLIFIIYLLSYISNWIDLCTM